MGSLSPQYPVMLSIWFGSSQVCQEERELPVTSWTAITIHLTTKLQRLAKATIKTSAFWEQVCSMGEEKINSQCTDTNSHSGQVTWGLLRAYFACVNDSTHTLYPTAVIKASEDPKYGFF